MADQELIDRLTAELRDAEVEEEEAASLVDFLSAELEIAEADARADA